MNEQDIQQQLEAQQQALTQIYTSVEKTRKYMMWSGIISILLFVLPLLVLLIALPWVTKTLTSSVSIDAVVNNSGKLGNQNFSETLRALQSLGL